MKFKITEQMRNFIIEQNNLVFVATSDKKNRPNVAPKALLSIGENTLLYADIFMDRTAKNILENNQISIAAINPFKCSGYQFKGRANVSKDGLSYKTATKKFTELGFEKPLHSIELIVDEIFFFEQITRTKRKVA